MFTCRNALMFNNEHMADVHFIVGTPGESERVPAHKVSPHTSLFFLSPKLNHQLNRNRCQKKEEIQELDKTLMVCLFPPLSVCAGSGELCFLCHVLRGSRGRGF